jgi:hypothetical protein
MEIPGLLGASLAVTKTFIGTVPFNRMSAPKALAPTAASPIYLACGVLRQFVSACIFFGAVISSSAYGQTSPLAPTEVIATTSNIGYGQAKVQFSAPTGNGGAPISSYTVTANPGGTTISGPTSPLFIGGLAYGTTYTFSVRAINSIGASTPSTASVPLLISAPSTARVAKSGFANLRVLLVPFHFPEMQPPFPITQVQDQLMGDHAYSARALWQRNSYDAFRLNVDVKPWTALRNSKTYHQGQDGSGSSLLNEALAMVAENYSLSGYGAVAVMLTPLENGYPGMATYQRPGLPIGASGTTLPVLVFSGNGFSGGVGTALMGHEIGHVLGFMHTSTISCSGTGSPGWSRSVPPALSDPYFDEAGCGNAGQATLFPYALGDPMGIYTGQTHALNMLDAGWLDPDQVQVASPGSNTYLDALDRNSDGLKAVTVNVGNTPDGHTSRYTVDYRSDPLLNPDTREMDAGSSNIADRLTVWLDLPELWNPDSRLLASTTHLNFAAFNTSKQYEMNLSVNEVFWDQYRGLRIKRGADRTQNGVKQAQVSVERSTLAVVPELFVRLTTGQSQQFTLRNEGTTSLIVNSTTLKGRHTSQFKLLQDGCSRVSLAPKASCQVGVLFVGGPALTDSNAAQAYLQWDNTDTLRPQATVGIHGVPNHSAMLVKGWNLLGNPINQPVNVATNLGNVSQVSTVWKWLPTGTTPGVGYPTWAFYAPALADSGRAYAASKGYDFLSTVNAGEGFWVEANANFTFTFAIGTAVTLTSLQNLAPGWHLIAIGSTSTPSGFNSDISPTPPATVAIPQNLASLWTWDNLKSKWYFYSPGLEAQGGNALSDFISSSGYLDFNSSNKTLAPGVGFWVKKP